MSEVELEIEGNDRIGLDSSRFDSNGSLLAEVISKEEASKEEVSKEESFLEGAKFI